MSSILTNNSAMVALQTLKSINMNLGKVQSEISTGKTIESAKDNAAVWAISKVMSADVAGFNAIADSLALGQATVGVALNASESITDLLEEVKGKIVNAQEENVPRDKIQDDIVALTNQIKSIVGAAQFNGLNLINDDGLELKDQTANILSSLDRAGDGTVTSSTIGIDRVNLSTDKATYDATASFNAGGATGGAVASGNMSAGGADVTTAAISVAGTSITELAGTAFIMELTATDADDSSFTQADFNTADGSAAGTGGEIVYVAQEGDTDADVAAGLKAAFDVWQVENNRDADALSITANADGTLTLSNNIATAAAGDTINVAINVRDSDGTGDGNTRAGSLQMLSAIDVSTDEGAIAALGAIEGLISSSIDTAAALGSTGRQIDTQADFVGKLTDRLTSGIGALVDADMEAASAKLQALQTQQQLGVQALSIANQAPQTILSLFR